MAIKSLDNLTWEHYYLANIRNMKFNFIDKIGVEIEGGWDKHREDLIPDAGIRMEDFKKSAICGELVSKPIDNYDEVEAFLRANWPTETQSMCGLHFHFSFKDISHYTALMHKNFRKYFLDAMQKFGRRKNSFTGK